MVSISGSFAGMSAVVSAYLNNFHKKKDYRTEIAFLLALSSIVVPDLLLMVLGGVVFWLFQSMRPSDAAIKKRKSVRKTVDDTDYYPEKPRCGRSGTDSTSFRKIPQSRMCAENIVVPPGKDRSATVQPIEQPVFASVGWEAEVAELVGQIMPNVESDQAVQQLARIVKQGLSKPFPRAEVIGIASGDFRRGKAFGVAVPEVDIVVNLNPDYLTRCLASRSTMTCASSGKDEKTNAHVQKSAMRIMTDFLVSKGRFRFRRSAFRGTEPKITLLAPAQSDLADFAIPFELSINSRVPMYNMALLSECERMEPRAKELILLVRRWAKDRGVCFAAKGHLSPYLWTILTIYFLQVGVDEEGPLLPPLRRFRLSSVLNGERANEADGWTPPLYAGTKKTTAALFKEFMRFYNQKFSWQHEAISIRLGERAPPDPALEGRGKADNAPTIENPFEAKQNLSSTMSSTGVDRLREEFVRADKLCTDHASLNDLLALWAPPENEVQANDE